MNSIRTHVHRAAARPASLRLFSSSTSRSLTRPVLVTAGSNHTTRCERVRLQLIPTRYYTSQAPPPTDATSSSSPQTPVEEGQEEYEDEEEESFSLELQALQSLEDAAHSPWVNLPSSNDRESLERSYFLLFQVFMYLGRPQKNVTEEEAAEYLLSFQDDLSPFDSEMDRARKAVCLILSAVSRTMSTVPTSSPLRERHKQIFDTLGALVPLNDMYLGGKGMFPGQGEIGDWKEFWERAMPVCITLCQQLNMAGFGFDDDEWGTEVVG